MSSTHREHVAEGHYVTVQHCEAPDCDKYLGVSYPSNYCNNRCKDMAAGDPNAWPMIPAHLRNVHESDTGFCTRGETRSPDGHCPDGCDHAEHYSNDGHPACADSALDIFKIKD